MRSTPQNGARGAKRIPPPTLQAHLKSQGEATAWHSAASESTAASPSPPLGPFQLSALTTPPSPMPMFPPTCLGYAYRFTAQIWQLLLHPLVSYQTRPAHCPRLTPPPPALKNGGSVVDDIKSSFLPGKPGTTDLSMSPQVNVPWFILSVSRLQFMEFAAGPGVPPAATIQPVRDSWDSTRPGSTTGCTDPACVSVLLEKC